MGIRKSLVVVLSVLALSSTGCKTLAVYDTEFQCNDRPDGKCQSIDDSLKTSVKRTKDWSDTGVGDDAGPASEYGSSGCSNPWGLGCTPYSPYIKRPQEKDYPTILRAHYKKGNDGNGVPGNGQGQIVLTEGKNSFAAPLRDPGAVLRVFLWDYVDAKGQLYGSQYVYFEAMPPSWDLDTIEEN